MATDTARRDLAGRLLGIGEQQGAVALIALLCVLFIGGVVYSQNLHTNATLDTHVAAATKLQKTIDDAIAERKNDTNDMKELLRTQIRMQALACKRLSRTVDEASECGRVAAGER